ncbi:MAG TPA: adenylate/guanylate cyclase domain-containing protein [Leptolyngbyaceae cyanobacterium]
MVAIDAIIPPNEQARLAAVQRYNILDTRPDHAFDHITALAAHFFKVPIAIVSIVDKNRIWFKSHYGVDVEQIDREPGLCASAILEDTPWLVTDAKLDPRTLTNPLVAGEFGLRFYAGAQLRTSDGFNLGMICVLDKQPRQVTEEEVNVLKILAALVVDELELRLAAKKLEAEKRRSEQLLLNILPVVVADELKHRGKVEPVNYESVSVLFTDFKGFTELSEQLTPKQLVDELDYCFSYFDEVIEKHNLEKLKTIGDSYMAVGGIPNVNSTHAIDAVLAALEIQAFIEQRKEQHMRNNTPYWEMRIGIHSGSLIAGVIGQKKFAYDVWGDTVNTASRMESSGVPGKINISQSTFELIKDFFVCNYRGKLPAKNKGDLDMYFVKGIKQGFSPELLSILNKNKVQYLDLAIQSAQCCQEKKRHSILTM